MSEIKKSETFPLLIEAIHKAAKSGERWSKQQLVDALVLVINGKIAQSWEQSAGITAEKTQLIEAKKQLSDLSFKGKQSVDDRIIKVISSNILSNLSVMKQWNARKKADAQGGGDLLGDDDGALGPEEEYNDYSSSN